MRSLLWPVPFRMALLLAVAVSVVTWLVVLPRTRGSGWRVDEAHKVSESYALRLLLEGRWSDPAWSTNIVDRTNPPFGKYVFGLAVLASGEELPRVPSLSRLAGPDGVMEPYVSAGETGPYLPLLGPCRRVSLLATSLTFGLVAFVAARLHSATAALIAAAWGVGHWMTSQFGGDAIFDPLLTLLIFATLPLLLSRRALPIAPLVGLLCAMAFQTRLNGGIALAASLAVLAYAARRHKPARVAAAIVVVTFAVASVAMNPYYWAGDGDVVGRFERQVSDLRAILDALTRDGVRLPLWAAESPARAPVDWTALEKLRFTWIALGGGVAGVALAIGAIAGGWVAIRQDEASPAALLWSAVVIAGTLLWLPLPWARYLLIVLPPLTLLAGIGYAGGLRGVFEACM